MTPRRGGTPRVVLVGGGTSVAELVVAMADELPHEEMDLQLVARDPATLDVIAGHCRHLTAARPGWRLTATRSHVDAFEGADVIVLMLRVGGLAARLHDDELAARFGLPGDEGLGVAGLANALRTLPVLAEVAQDIARCSPDASVLNLVAPLGLTTRVLLDRGIDAFGVCELPLVTERQLRATLPAGVELAYGGYNHLGWFWAPDLDAEEAFRGAVAARLVDPEVLGRYGAVPLKYFSWLFAPDGGASLGIARAPNRTASLLDLRRRALDEMRRRPAQRSDATASRPTPWFSEALVPHLDCVLQGRSADGYGNIRNGELEPGLPPDTVVERALQLRGREVVVAPRSSPLPDEVARFLETIGAIEDLTYRCWADRRFDLVRDVLRLNPDPRCARQADRLARAVGQSSGDVAPVAGTMTTMGGP